MDAAADALRVRVDGRAGVGQHRSDAGGAGGAAGRRPRRRRSRRPALPLHLARLLVVRRHRRQPRPADARARDAARRRGRRSGHVVGRAAAAGGVGGRDGRARSDGHDPARRKRPARRDRPRTCRRSRRRQLRLRRAAPRRHHASHPLLLRGHAARARAPARRAASGVQHGRHARRRLARERVPLPVVALRPAGRLSVRRGDGPGRRGGPLHRRSSTSPSSTSEPRCGSRATAR